MIWCRDCKYYNMSTLELPCKGCYNTKDKKNFVSLVDNLKDTVSSLATQVGGSHYQLPIQPIDYIVKNNLGYREGNVIKYVSRHKTKNGAEDIKKAIHYLEMILEEYENE